MNEVPLFQLSCACAKSLEEAVCDRLREVGGVEPVVMESADPDAPRVSVEVYYEDMLVAELTRAAAARVFPELVFAITPVAAQDWTTFWRHHFKPLALGRRIWVAPEWEADAAPADRPLRIILNPGLSFGTGNHFTTRFCLEALDDGLEDPPGSVLDAGCGSGILAIGAALAGVPRVLGVDFDPIAVEQSRENAARNGVAERIDFQVLDLTQSLPGETFDLVFANLYDELLIRLAPRLAGLSRDRLVLTGIRTVMADAVAPVFEAQGLREIRRDSDPEWCGLVFRREG